MHPGLHKVWKTILQWKPLDFRKKYEYHIQYLWKTEGKKIRDRNTKSICNFSHNSFSYYTNSKWKKYVCWLPVTDTGHRIVKVETGGLEVKTISDFTFRTNDNNEPSGTLPFELWNGDRYGWLLALLHPELRLTPEKEIHAVQPVLFSFLLVSYPSRWWGITACIKD